MLADIEEAETGNEGRVREWLQRAVKAPRNAAWVADGQISDHWLPFSPISGKLDAFEWKVPVMLLSGGAPEIDLATFNRVSQGPALIAETVTKEPVTKEAVSTLKVESAEAVDTETLDAETALRSAGFKPVADASLTKKKSGFRLF